MKTIFVSGNNTDVGKTWVVGTIAAHLARQGKRIQIVKPVESGSTDPDAEVAARMSGTSEVDAFTLHSLTEPISPVAAAERDGVRIDFDAISEEMKKLPSCDIRIVEGAGSIATPLDHDGRDWADFAKHIEASATVLVVDYKLGAIGQSRMTHAYARERGLLSGIWLNQTAPQDELVLESTLAGLENSATPIWGVQLFNSDEAEWRDFPEID